MPIYPKLHQSFRREPRRRAEMSFYDACGAGLPDSWTTIYSLRWIATLGRAPRDGETDFLILVPDQGFLAVEVKGGRIGYDASTDTWYSFDQSGVRHDLNRSPFGQAEDEKRAVLQKLEAHPQWSALGNDRLVIGHSVFFPDLDPTQVSHVVGPDRPAEIIGGADDLGQLRGWVERVLRFWRGRRRPTSGVDRRWTDIARDQLLRSFEVRPLLRNQLKSDGEIRVRLTRDQARVLRMLGERKRAAVCGGAGTGKTMLALQRARELADQGMRVLLLCHTRALADSLQRQNTHAPLLQVMTLCRFGERRAAGIKQKTGVDLLAEAEREHRGKNYFNTQIPYVLLRSLDLDPSEQYDAIIVDEAQDFSDDYWTPLPFFLKDERESYFYIFYDQNQRVFNRSASFPIEEPPFPLVVNCRNTRYIHELSYKYFQGEQTDPPDNEGAPVDLLEGADPDAQAQRIYREICRLITTERVAPQSIVVLVAGMPPDLFFALLERQGQPPAPTEWSVRSHWKDGTVLLDTVRRYKGLESEIIFMWGLDELDSAIDTRALYVGLSRAMSRLYLVGKRATLQRIKQAYLGPQPVCLPPAGDWLPE